MTTNQDPRMVRIMSTPFAEFWYFNRVIDAWNRNGSCEEVGHLLDLGQDELETRFGMLEHLFWSAVEKQHYGLAACAAKLGYDFTSSDFTHAYLPGGAVYSAISRFGNCPDVLSWLISKGANMECRGPNGYAPLHLAVSKSIAASVNALLTNGADVHAGTIVDDNDTPLHIAARNGDETIYQLLVRWGADPTSRNAYGEQASELLARAVGGRQIRRK